MEEVLVEKHETYNDRKVAEVIDIEVKINDKSDIKRRESFVRKTVFAAGILSALFLRNQLTNEKFDLLGTAFGGGFTAVFFAFYFNRLGNKSILENDLILLRQNYNFEIDNLDLDGINMLDSKRKELGLVKKKKK